MNKLVDLITNDKPLAPLRTTSKKQSRILHETDGTKRKNKCVKKLHTVPTTEARLIVNQDKEVVGVIEKCKESIAKRKIKVLSMVEIPNEISEAKVINENHSISKNIFNCWYFLLQV